MRLSVTGVRLFVAGARLLVTEVRLLVTEVRLLITGMRLFVTRSRLLHVSGAHALPGYQAVGWASPTFDLRDRKINQTLPKDLIFY
ncbi:hypothetical protein [Nodosilinea sp. FACHB-13]|uniref:hypothetical protein n=1 Tax=Cyanophyceae TaxID=3028117 RepID=UPI0016897E29|nr:hypothetical protein [Nodosilinea sp. FACHB-13]MBD2108526.1 hypothetical protein [Nodosilinea sp. FACHB-13]